MSKTVAEPRSDLGHPPAGPVLWWCLEGQTWIPVVAKTWYEARQKLRTTLGKEVDPKLPGDYR